MGLKDSLPKTPWQTEWEAVATVIASGEAAYSEAARTAIEALRLRMESVGALRPAIDRTIVVAMDRGMSRRVRPQMDIEGQRRIATKSHRQSTKSNWGVSAKFDPLLTIRSADPDKGEVRRGGNGNFVTAEKKVVAKRGRPVVDKVTTVDKWAWADDAVGAKSVQASWLIGPDKDGDGLMIGIFYLNGTDTPHQCYKVKRAVGIPPITEKVGTPTREKSEAVERFYAPTVQTYKESH